MLFRPALAVLLLSAFAFATPGIFTGEVVPPPQPTEGSVLYVKGRNAMVRRVEFGGARIVYGDSVAEAERRHAAREQLVPGTEVRVTADQHANGDWRARQVEIIRTAKQR